MKKRNLIAVLMSVVLAATSTVDMPTFAAADQPQEITEQEAVAYLCAELGIDDWDAYIADLAARYHADENNGGTRDTCPFDPDYFIDIYTGGSSNGQVDSLDAMYLLNFLNGKVNYPYVYTDLDPTQDSIVDRADVQALMDCFTMVILLEEYPDFVPGTHGATREIHLDFENRSYVCCSYPSCQTTSYQLSLNMLNSSTNTNINITENKHITRHEINTSRTSMNPTYDSRIVRIGSLIPDNNGGYIKEYSGTGFIIGSHLIATAAHCVYNANPVPAIQDHFINGFNMYRAVFACTNASTPSDFTNNCTSLTIQSIHIPELRINGTDNQKAQHDYALIVVEDDLSTYGCFEDASILLDDNANLTSLATPLAVHTTGFYDDINSNPHVYNILLHTNPTLISITPSGHLQNGYQICPYRFNITPSSGHARSGGVAYFANTDGYYSDSMFGIIVSGGNSVEQGVLITRPLLQFFRNNPHPTVSNN